MQLTTTSAIITGGASGLGEATARYFAKQDAQVTILDRDAARGAQVAAEIGGHFVETDVTNEESVAAAVRDAVEKMGRITATVNCAGIAYGIKTVGKDGPHPLDAFQRTIDINLVGTFNVARLASAEMAKNRVEFLFLADLADAILDEEYRHPALKAGVLAADLQVIDVVPAVLVKRIVDHRRAEQKPYLVARHADLDLVQIFLLDQVTLRDSRTVDAAAGRNQGETEHKQGDRFTD